MSFHATDASYNRSIVWKWLESRLGRGCESEQREIMSRVSVSIHRVQVKKKKKPGKAQKEAGTSGDATTSTSGRTDGGAKLNSTARKGKGKFEGPSLASFWTAVPRDEQLRLTSIPAQDVLRVVAQQRRTACTCQACSQNHDTLEEELAFLFDQFLSDLRVSNSKADSGHLAIAGTHGGTSALKQGKSRKSRGGAGAIDPKFSFSDTFRAEDSDDGACAIVVNRAFLNDHGARVLAMLEYLGESRTRLDPEANADNPDELDVLVGGGPEVRATSF